MAFSTRELSLSWARLCARPQLRSHTYQLRRVGCGSFLGSQMCPMTDYIKALDSLRKPLSTGVSMWHNCRGQYYSSPAERLHPEHPHPCPASSHLPCRTLGHTRGSSGAWELASCGGSCIPCCYSYLKGPLFFEHKQVRAKDHFCVTTLIGLGPPSHGIHWPVFCLSPSLEDLCCWRGKLASDYLH